MRMQAAQAVVTLRMMMIIQIMIIMVNIIKMIVIAKMMIIATMIAARYHDGVAQASGNVDCERFLQMMRF